VWARPGPLAAAQECHGQVGDERADEVMPPAQLGGGTSEVVSVMVGDAGESRTERQEICGPAGRARLVQPCRDEFLDTGASLPVSLRVLRRYCVPVTRFRPVAACRPGCRFARVRYGAAKATVRQHPAEAGMSPHAVGERDSRQDFDDARGCSTVRRRHRVR
jgi:hypothetical protein